MRATNEPRRQESGSIRRDYWRLVAAVTEGAPTHVLIQGRRRTSEAYWPGLKLPISLFERLRRAVHQSCRVAAAYPGAPTAGPTWFPSRETLAVCHGPGYVLELSETRDGRGETSLQLVISDPAADLRPCVFLIDHEQASFAADLDRIAAVVSAAATEYRGAINRSA